MRLASVTSAVFTFAALSVVNPAHPQSSSATVGAGASGGTDPSGSGLRLERPTRVGAFVDVVGRRSAFVGYEHRGLEAWIYPLKLLDDLRLEFRLEGYPLSIEGTEVLARIAARPESTTLTYSHAAFTARAELFAPVDEPALVLLLDAETTLPVEVTVSFRPRLRLMWPAGLQTGNTGWRADARAYEITEESGRYAGVIGSPAAGGTSRGSS